VIASYHNAHFIKDLHSITNGFCEGFDIVQVDDNSNALPYQGLDLHKGVVHTENAGQGKDKSPQEEENVKH
jgi:hypothetical protein